MQNIREQHLYMLQWQRFISHCTKALREAAQTRADSVAKLHTRVDVIQHSAAKTAGLSAALLCLPVFSHCALFPPVHQLCNHLIAHWTNFTHQSSRNEKKSPPFWLMFELNLPSTGSVKHDKKKGACAREQEAEGQTLFALATLRFLPPIHLLFYPDWLLSKKGLKPSHLALPAILLG